MKKYESVTKKTEMLTGVICDRCGNVINVEDDIFEFQEIHSIFFVGGYGSVFGDGSTVQCDLCQNCLMDLIREFCYVDGERIRSNR